MFVFFGGPRGGGALRSEVYAFGCRVWGLGLRDLGRQAPQCGCNSVPDLDVSELRPREL